MGGNTGNGHRSGQVKGRKQVFNPRTKQYVKLDTETGKIIGNKDTPYKGVRKHKAKNVDK